MCSLLNNLLRASVEIIFPVRSLTIQVFGAQQSIGPTNKWETQIRKLTDDDDDDDDGDKRVVKAFFVA